MQSDEGIVIPKRSSPELRDWKRDNPEAWRTATSLAATPESLVLAPALRHRIAGHITAELPREACGLVTGEAPNVAVRVLRAINEAPEIDRYLISLEQLERLFNEIRRRREKLVAIYHSHVGFGPEPIPIDRLGAYYPEALYLIGSVIGRKVTLHAYRIIKGKYREVDIQWQ